MENNKKLEENNKEVEENNNIDDIINLFHPFEFLSFLCFYSPVIVAILITFLSFVNQNFKGIIYLGFLIGLSLIRLYIYKFNEIPASKYDKNKDCNKVQFSEYGNLTFSSFVFSYTITYLSLPMFSNNSPNFWVFVGLNAYFLIDLFFKFAQGCYEMNEADLFLNILSGVASGFLIVCLLYGGGSSKYLFFNEVASNNTMCYKPKNQTFKCSVFKDGTLVGSL
jgi:hypothetical protein